MKDIKILFKDNNKPGNVDVIKFLKANIGNLNRAGIKVHFRIVTKNEIPKLIERGVTKLPILVVGKKIVEQSSKIKEGLKDLYEYNMKHGGKNGKSGKGGKFSSLDPDQQMREFMEQDLSFEAYDNDDGDPDNNGDIMDKVISMAAQRTADRQKENSSRTKGRERGRKGSNPRSANSDGSGSAVDRIRKSMGGMNNREDQLMIARFEETGISNDL